MTKYIRETFVVGKGEATSDIVTGTGLRPTLGRGTSITVELQLNEHGKPVEVVTDCQEHPAKGGNDGR